MKEFYIKYQAPLLRINGNIEKKWGREMIAENFLKQRKELTTKLRKYQL